MTRYSRRRYQVIPNADDNFTMGKFEMKELVGGVENWVRHPVSGNYENRTCQFPYSYWKYCDDENHGSNPRTGGPLTIQLVDFMPSLGTVIEGGTYFTRDGSMRYAGGFSFVTGSNLPAGFYLPSAPHSQKTASLPSMNEPANRAYNGARPKIQQVGLLNALAEAPEIPGMLRTTAQGFHQLWSSLGGRPSATGAMLPNAAANQFLNHQFGWVPFLNDVYGAINTYNNQASIIGRITQNNGRSVRRRFPAQVSVVETLISSDNSSPFTPTTLFDGFFSKPGGQPSTQIRDVKTTRIWGSGKFKYYIPAFDANLPDYGSAMNQAKRMMDIYGVRVNPSNIYQAIPWSWAVDWATNLGQYVQRASDFIEDGLMTEYFYAMCTEERIRTWETMYPLHTRSITCRQELRMTSKQRVEASSPLGFSRSWDTLTPRQFAIAGALGLSAPDRRR